MSQKSEEFVFIAKVSDGRNFVANALMRICDGILLRRKYADKDFVTDFISIANFRDGHVLRRKNTDDNFVTAFLLFAKL